MNLERENQQPKTDYDHKRNVLGSGCVLMNHPHDSCMVLLFSNLVKADFFFLLESKAFVLIMSFQSPS